MAGISSPPPVAGLLHAVCRARGLPPFLPAAAHQAPPDPGRAGLLHPARGACGVVTTARTYILLPVRARAFCVRVECARTCWAAASN